MGELLFSKMSITRRQLELVLLFAVYLMGIIVPFLLFPKELYAALLCFLLFTVIAIYRPKIAAYLLVVTSFAIPFTYVNRFFFEIPRVYSWIAEFLLIILFFRCLVLAYGKRIKKISNFFDFIPQSIFMFCIVWLLISTISSVINFTNPLVIPFTYRWIFHLPAAIFVFNYIFDVNEKKKLLKILVFISMINFPVIIVQRLWIDLTPSIVSADRASGLFSGYPPLVFFQWFCLLAVIIYWHGKKIKINKLPLFLILTFIVGTVALSNSRAAWLYGFATIVFVLFKTGIFKKNIKLAASIIVFVTIGVVLFGFAMTISYPTRANRMFVHVNPVYVFNHAFGDNPFEPAVPEERYHPTRGLYLQRGEAIIFNFHLIKDDIKTLMLGMGPGVVEPSPIPGLSGRLYEKYNSEYLGRTTIMRSLAELGIFGLIIWMLLLLIIANVRTPNDPNKENRILLQSMLFLVFILSSYYRIIFSIEFVLITSILLINQPAKTDGKNIKDVHS